MARIFLAAVTGCSRFSCRPAAWCRRVAESSDPRAGRVAFMASQWLYRHAERIYGPVTLPELQAAMLLGFIRPDDLVARPGRHCWKPLLEDAELRGVWEAVDGGTKRAREWRTTTEPDGE